MEQQVLTKYLCLCRHWLSSAPSRNSNIYMTSTSYVLRLCLVKQSTFTTRLPLVELLLQSPEWRITGLDVAMPWFLVTPTLAAVSEKKQVLNHHCVFSCGCDSVLMSGALSPEQNHPKSWILQSSNVLQRHSEWESSFLECHLTSSVCSTFPHFPHHLISFFSVVHLILIWSNKTCSHVTLAALLLLGSAAEQTY